MIEPVPASKFLSKYTPENQAKFINAGIVPVNDTLLPFWTNKCPVWLFYGGRGGGKSEGVFDRLIWCALSDQYFNCYYGRKVFDTIRKSCFETIVASIKKLHLTHLFSFSEADNSSMIIRCKNNGNKFQPFGADKPEKLKSIKDPSHVVCEEFDQFEFNDFIEIFPTLRTLRAECEFIGMFNTKDVLPDHWIIKLFFKELYTGTDKVTYDALEGVEVRKIFANFTDNYFIDQLTYRSKLRLAAAGNEQLLSAIAAGAWGVSENGNPWIYSFERNKHLKPVKFNPQLPIYLSFDFNNDPVACIAEQHSEGLGHIQGLLHYIHEFVGVLKIDELCMRVRSTFPQGIFFVTGDRSGSNEDLGRNQTLYQMIQSSLGINERCMNINTSNLYHADSRMLCNTMLAHYPHMYINPETCPTLVLDIQKAKVDGTKPQPSALLKDRAGYKMDVFDAWRYDLQTYFNAYAKRAYLGVIK